MRRLVTYLTFFVGGWLFNFIVDIKFFAGFLSGWLSHGAAADVIEWVENLVGA